MRHLYEAIRLIHAHGEGPFHERIFAALDLVFHGSRYALELFGKDGAYAMETTLPFHECRQSDILTRTEELVRLQSPMFTRLAAGEALPMRLSDFISLRELRRTDLYHEIFRQIHIQHQIGIPIQSPAVLGGLTINRERCDYRTEDLEIARILAPQIATAFEVDLLLRQWKRATEGKPEVDFTHLRRLGLSRREAEVLMWMAEAKRDREISIVLGISARTVQQHVRAILQKLHVENRTAAVALALRRSPKVVATTRLPHTRQS